MAHSQILQPHLGLAGPEKLNGFVKWSIGVAFWDYNRDGRLDAMVGNFLAFDPAYFTPATPDMMPHPSEYKGQASMLYEQQADGKFTDVTRKNNLYYPDSKCMGLTVFDYDDDGDLDIFQANDHQLNFMFRNDNGVYKEVGVETGVAANSKGIGTGSMHGSPGDIDGDGLIDILVTDLAYGALYLNKGNGLFVDVTESSRCCRAPWLVKGAGELCFLTMTMTVIRILLLLTELLKSLFFSIRCCLRMMVRVILKMPDRSMESIFRQNVQAEDWQYGILIMTETSTLLFHMLIRRQLLPC